MGLVTRNNFSPKLQIEVEMRIVFFSKLTCVSCVNRGVVDVEEK